MKYTDFTQQQIDKVVSLRLKYHTFKDISKMTGIKLHFIVKICYEYIDTETSRKIGKSNHVQSLNSVNYDRFDELYKQGMNDAEIATILNTNRQTIRKKRINLGLKPNIKRQVFTTEEDDTIITMVNNNETINKTAETLNRTTQSIYSRCYRLNLKIKDRK